MLTKEETLNYLKHCAEKELYKKSFYEFVKAFWNTADPSKFVDGKLIQFYCEIFQYFCRQWEDNYKDVDIKLPKQTTTNEIIDVRQGKKNLCLIVPPRHSKSMIFNVLGAVWLWLNHPIKAVSISHTEGLAKQMNEKRYAVINSPKFKEYFGDDIKLTKNTQDFLRDSRGGELYSLNRNSLTGYGGDVIINDDLTSAETARKDLHEMKNAWDYYQDTMPSRINDPQHCIIMNIQQRLAPNDIAGHIMSDKELSDQYVFVTLPAIFSHDTYLVCPISGDVILYKEGDYLWKERFGDYQSIRHQVGESIFQTQYLQNPIATDETVIKPNMIIEKDILDIPPISQADMIYASHDFTVKDNEKNDPMATCIAYRVGGTLYIKDCLEMHLDFNKSVQLVQLLHDQYNGGIIQIIEDKANGTPILNQLQDIVYGMQPYQPGTSSKTQRLESASLYMVSGNVVFIKEEFNPLTNTYELREPLQNLKNRLLNFPFVEHDDIVDAFSMLVLFVFLDKRYMVYGLSFNEGNIISIEEFNKMRLPYSTVFFNKEGDIWKVAEIYIDYAEESRIIVNRETSFKATIEDGLKKLHEFAPHQSVFIDCSASDALNGVNKGNTIVERYTVDDFDKSVSQLNLAFSKNLVLLTNNCYQIKSDIENFKFSKTPKDETVKFQTEKDGFVACLRLALLYYGI